jgi:hypothetical protein
LSHGFCNWLCGRLCDGLCGGLCNGLYGGLCDLSIPLSVYVSEEKRIVLTGLAAGFATGLAAGFATGFAAGFTTFLIGISL